jgi:hypothetical protein
MEKEVPILFTKYIIPALCPDIKIIKTTETQAKCITHFLNTKRL